VISKKEISLQDCINFNYNIYNNWKIDVLKKEKNITVNHLNRCTLVRNIDKSNIRNLFENLDINIDACYMSPEYFLNYLDIWETEFQKNNLMHSIPGFNVAFMNNPNKDKNKFRQYQRKIYAKKEKNNIQILKEQSKDKIIFDRFVSGARKTDNDFLGEKFIDQSLEWHKNPNNLNAYQRDERENILIVFYEFDPNYIKKGHSFVEGDEGFLNPDIPIVSYFISFNTGGPKYSIHNNIFQVETDENE
jgi:hypothetical protein